MFCSEQSYDNKCYNADTNNHTDTQSSNNAVLVYHVLARAWLGKWDNWNVTDFIPTAFSSDGPRLQWSGTLTSVPSSSSQIRVFTDYFSGTRLNPPPVEAFRDDGTSFTTTMVTRAFNFGDATAHKTGYNVQFYTENNFALPAYVSTSFSDRKSTRLNSCHRT